jgi:hypothetical protein
VDLKLGAGEIAQYRLAGRFPHGEIMVGPLPPRRLLLVALGANVGAHVTALIGVHCGVGEQRGCQQEHRARYDPRQCADEGGPHTVGVIQQEYLASQLEGVV